jgi:hypothetical protein
VRGRLVESGDLGREDGLYQSDDLEEAPEGEEDSEEHLDGCAIARSSGDREGLCDEGCSSAIVEGLCATQETCAQGE